MATKKNKLAGSILKDIGSDKKRKPGTQPASPTAKPQSKHQPIPGVELLGRGYNVVTEAYASADPPMPNLFDFSADGTVDQQIYDESLPQVRGNVENAFTTMPTELKLIYARPTNVQFTPLYEANLSFSKGESLNDQQQALAAHLGIEGNYGLFAAEFSARYASSSSRLATHKFYSVTAEISYYDLSMANYSLRPVGLLRPQVRKDLNDKSITAEEVFETYGTHYLYSVTIGSQIVYGHTIDTSKTTSSYDAEAELRASYGGEGVGIGVSGGASVSAASQQAADAEEIHFYAKGISDAQVKAAQSADTKPLALLGEAWHNPTLIDFPAGGLKPIWNLCDDPQRHDALEKAFDAYAIAHGWVGPLANLTPLYLCNHPKQTDSYLLSTNRNGRTVDGTTYKEATGDPEPEPWLYVFNSQQPGTVPLYEYFEDVGLPGVPNAKSMWRYETPAWDSWLTALGWRKSSGKPVGWVYDGLEAAPSDPASDVYTYATADAIGYLYSTDSADGRDGGMWLPVKDYLDSNSALNPAAPSVTLPANAWDTNVHWRTPSM